MSDVESDSEKPESKKEKEESKKAADDENDDDETSESGSESGESDVSEEEDDDEGSDDDLGDIENILGEDAVGAKKKTANKKNDIKPVTDSLLNSIFGNSADEEADDEYAEDEDENDGGDAYDEEKYGFKYLQKFDNDTRKQITDEYHRESLQHSYEEIDVMCRIVRTQDGIIDALHRTPPFLTKYEKTRILGERAKQLGAGAKAFIELADDMIDEYTIAVLELQQGKLPFIIKRPLPNGGCEYWRLADLEVL